MWLFGVIACYLGFYVAVWCCTMLLKLLCGCLVLYHVTEAFVCWCCIMLLRCLNWCRMNVSADALSKGHMWRVFVNEWLSIETG